MKHAKHSKPLRAARIALALLAALAASTAAGQTAGQAAGPTQAGERAPAPPGPSYGPVLHPPPVKSEPGFQPGQTPQAQEEKAGANPASRALEVDPSARPAPQPKETARADGRREQKKGEKKGASRTSRRSAPQDVDAVAVAMPGPPVFAAPPPAQPMPLQSGPAQINSCLGGVCTDTGGATYHTGVGNAAVNSGGRLCTRSGNTMQCF